MNTRLNKTDYSVLVIVYFIFILLNCISYYKVGNELIEYLVDIPSAIITSFCIILLFMYWVIPNFLIKRTDYFSLTFFGLIILSFFGSLDYTLEFWSGSNDWNKFPKWYDLILNGIFDSTYDTGFVFGLILAKKFYESQIKISNIQKEQKENELKFLRSQLNPHFLFNNLNTLDALIDDKPNKAKEYINRLSLVYRYLIKTKDAEVMELKEEINFAENYIFLIKTRFENDYEFEIIKNISLSDKFVPTGAIQILVENVVKHNKSQNNKQIMTTICINDGWLIVTNTKSKIKSSDESFGTGLDNLKTRYSLLSDDKVKIIDMGERFEVFIPIIKLSS